MRGKKDLKTGFSSFKSRVGQVGTKTRARASTQKESRENPARDRRRAPFVVPVGMQTVMAVLVCCAVFICAGFILIGADQKEIINLKSDLKAYSEDGVVPATTLNDTIDLSMEAICGRLATLQSVLDSRSEENKNTLTNEQMQWFGTELAAVTAESRDLNKILTSIETDKTVDTAYKEKILVPLASLQSAYEGMKVSDTDIANTKVEDGAATDTGSFKSTATTKTKLTLFILIGAAILVVAVLLLFFRKKIAALLGSKGGKRNKRKRNAKTGTSRQSEGDEKAKSDAKDKSKVKSLFGAKSKSNRRGTRREGSHSRDILADLNGEENKATDGAGEAADGEKKVGEAQTEQAKQPIFDFESEVLASVNSDFVDTDDPLLRLAAMHKAEAAAKAAADADAGKQDLRKELGVAEEGLMSFDPKVASQDAIDDEDDPFFKKNGDA